jgi:ectoine hydroxylase-related dioxygenase (phytanoyl-CoA dioxygenase family)
MTAEYKQILPDKNADLQLAQDGYVVFPLLDEKKTAALLYFYRQYHPQETPGMSASAHAEDISYRKQMSEAIRNSVLPLLQKLDLQLKVLGGSFITKASGTTTTLAAHQDWNITDERHFRSFNIWLPLVDTGKANGGIMVLPKSHLLGLNYRGPGIPSFTEHAKDIIDTALISLEIPAGHALLYDHRLIHASGPNLSPGSRVVAVLGALQKDAPMHIYYGTEKGVQVYACPAEFFLEGNPNEGPGNLTLLANILTETKSPDRWKVVEMLRNAGVALPETKAHRTVSRNWWTRLF